MTALTPAPRLTTGDLILRSPEPRDAEPVIRFLMDKPRAWGFGAYDNRGDAWRWFALNIGHWHLHGYGYFTVENQGQPAGLCGIWNPEGWPEPEIGWLVFDGFEGHSIAYRAALCARDWAYDALGLTTLTSNIVPGNDRSVRLAERLGAWFERSYQNVHMGEEMLYRHPGPADLLREGRA